MRRILKRDFFDRRATEVAPDLLGKFLTLEGGGAATGYMIVETEAYDGHDDRASHASKGRTPRIGVAYAGERAKKPWRYVVQKNEGVPHGTPSAA